MFGKFYTFLLLGSAAVLWMIIVPTMSSDCNRRSRKLLELQDFNTPAGNPTPSQEQVKRLHRLRELNEKIEKLRRDLGIFASVDWEPVPTSILKPQIYSSVVVVSPPAAGDFFRLQILHTNDMHARFEEADRYGGRCSPAEKECPRFGGFARVKRAVDTAKKEARLAGYPSIFLNAGDTFQGTAHYTLFKWKIVAPLIDALGIDVMGLGNHEFDDGIDNLVQYLNVVKTPVVACNLNLASERRLELPNLTPSYTLIVDGIPIGVIGYLTPETMQISSVENLEILDEIPYLRAEAQRLKRKGVRIIIAIGHSGFERDVQIAEAVPEVSIIIGGHSHSLLHTPQEGLTSDDPIVAPYPYVVTSKSGKKTLVLQAFKNTKYLGKLIATFDDSGNIRTAEGNTILLDSTIEKDPAIQKLVSDWSGRIDEQLEVVKGHTKVFLGKHNYSSGQYESNLGNLLTDAFVDYGVYYASKEVKQPWMDAPIAIIQSKGIRIEIDHSSITLGDIYMMLPFGNRLCIATYKGSTIKKALEFAVSSTSQNDEEQSTLFASGMRVVYNFSNLAGSRVRSVELLCGECRIPQYYPLELDRAYNVVLTEYMAGGGDRYEMLRNERLNIISLGITDADAFSMYLEKLKIVYPALENRISVE